MLALTSSLGILGVLTFLPPHERSIVFKKDAEGKLQNGWCFVWTCIERGCCIYYKYIYNIYIYICLFVLERTYAVLDKCCHAYHALQLRCHWQVCFREYLRLVLMLSCWSPFVKGQSLGPCRSHVVVASSHCVRSSEAFGCLH